MPAPSFRSSGDILADRRFLHAQAAFDDHAFQEAVELARQSLERAPGYAPAHALLGRAEAALGRREPAIDALHRALALEPHDPIGVRIDLARLGALDPAKAVSDGYVRALFDDYAPQFERHLLKKLGYRGPELIGDALRRAAVRRFRDERFGLVLDLGCGTGLMARALAGRYERAEGVDLSPRMLHEAARTKLYEELHEGDLVSFLKGRATESADLAVAADVFVYMASLGEVFREAWRVLAPGGFFAFTVQEGEGDGVVLGEDARYAHGEAYLRRLSAEAGFAELTFDRVATRCDRGAEVPGFLAVLERLPRQAAGGVVGCGADS